MIGNESNVGSTAESQPAKDYLELTATHGLCALAAAAVLGGLVSFYPTYETKSILIYAGLVTAIFSTFVAFAVIFKEE